MYIFAFYSHFIQGNDVSFFSPVANLSGNTSQNEEGSL